MLEIRSLSKSFPGQVALDDAQLVVRAGKVNALVGQNGSGKSTMIKVLAGYHTPDPGADVRMLGRTVDLGALDDADRGRLRIMHQDLGLVDSMSVTENMAFGRGFHARILGRLRWADERRRVATLLERFGVSIDPRAAVGGLAPAERSVIGLMRAVQDWDEEGGILILDEPTASLPRPEVDRLFSVIRRVAARGAGIVFVSHRLDEVFEIADEITVLRDGRTQAVSSAGSLDHAALVSLIVGRPIEELYTEPPEVGSGTAMTAAGLWGEVLEDFSVAVRHGEIVGVAGITGSGREEVAGLVAGRQRRAAGSIEVEGQRVGNGFRAALAAGVRYVPAERKQWGSVQQESTAANIVLGGRAPDRRSRWWLTRRAQHRDAAAWVQRLDIRPSDPAALFSALSGGNQQKAVIARCLRRAPRLLVLDEPTQGVDVGAKATIYAQLADAAAAGAAVLICSSDAEELASTCDRVLVLRDGRTAAVLEHGNLTHQLIVETSLR